ncbi:uncharacterized protein LOC143914362 [Arctopsyche grandis]|uniref:uncharacterized protein LOC143914362 n=1 Tax=Arctopsyche grandis TaxID=121162 RepID=UPI00406D76B6
MASKISLEFLQELMNEENPDVTLSSFQLAPGSGRGDNYTAMLYRVYVEGFKIKRNSVENDDNVKQPWERSIIYKCLPDSIVRREAYKSDALFCNEVAFYTKINPALLSFQREFLNDSESFKAIPHCYLARNDVLILEDLHCRGFSMADRKSGLTTEQCAAVLKELAHFHALSLAMKQQRTEEFYELLNLQDGISEGLFDVEHEEWYRGYYNVASRNALAMVKEALPSEDDRTKYLKKFDDFVGDGTFFTKMVSLVSPNEPLAVFCHGDCWTNNILFKYSPEGTIDEVCLVDFQLVRYGSPALDLANLIYCCTSRDQRAEHLTDLLKMYHETLHTRLMQLTDECQRCSQIYDKDTLWEMIDEEFHKCGKFGLGLALDMIPISTCDSDQAPDLYQDKDADTSIDSLEIIPVWTSNELCRRKMADLVQELVDKGDL